jgi:hypothetical protein
VGEADGFDPDDFADPPVAQQHRIEDLPHSASVESGLRTGSTSLFRLNALISREPMRSVRVDFGFPPTHLNHRGTETTERNEDLAPREYLGGPAKGGNTLCALCVLRVSVVHRVPGIARHQQSGGDHAVAAAAGCCPGRCQLSLALPSDSAAVAATEAGLPPLPR